MSEKLLDELLLVVERIIYTATGLQEQFNPETYEVDAEYILELVRIYSEIEENDNSSVTA